MNAGQLEIIRIAGAVIATGISMGLFTLVGWGD